MTRNAIARLPARRRPAPAAPPRSAPEPDGGFGTPVLTDAERRQRMIAKAAYQRASWRGFAPGHELDDWLTAEREIDERLFSGDIPLE